MKLRVIEKMTQLEFEPTLAKPGIPVETPQRREIPDIPDLMPSRVPVVPVPHSTPVEPVRTPREPVPAGR